MPSTLFDTMGQRRGLRIGGYVMSHDLVKQWAMRLCDLKEITEEEASVSADLVAEKLELKEKYNLKMRSVGEQTCENYMIITHRARVKGAYVNTPASYIEQFEPNDVDEKIQYLLKEHGFQDGDFKFETWLD
ncbi:hypothetical protein GALMADRAFT_278299 [Galerina marginata CBS 339.88]|uniref:Uncharacterized protein n=1 Tax=Galerina marginata (strain CBS 339.88) TaxID=685588 RepID=A0A067T6B7_GALM3|nr:hypothetical protein GALMADRAFT_278299 [Galerina marginata CBS 339.88]